MAFRSVFEPTARWDADKARIIGAMPAHTFGGSWGDARPAGELLAGDWWRIESGELVVGYGWMDVNWGDAEILLVTAPEARGKGVGSYILETLSREARARGLNYMCNVIPDDHPDGEAVSGWLKRRGFASGEDPSLLRAQVPPLEAA